MNLGGWLSSMKWVLPIAALALVLVCCVNWPTRLGNELISASARGEVAVIDSLIRAGANPDAIGFETGPGLVEAVKHGQYAAVEALIRNGASVDRLSPGGNSALYWAVAEENQRMVEHLLSVGAKPSNLPKDNEAHFWKLLNEPSRVELLKLLNSKGFFEKPPK